MLNDKLESASDFWVDATASLEIVGQLSDDLDDKIGDVLEKGEVWDNTHDVHEVLAHEFHRQT